MSEELITLHSAGALPGIPGEHAAGQYWVDMGARTIRPAQPLDTQPEPMQSAYATQPLEEPLQGDLEAGEAPQPDNTLAADQSGIQA